jgi:hypothetical protein
MMGTKPTPEVDEKTAKGAGEGGHSPHPDTPEPPAPFDPHSYAPSDAADAKAPKQNAKPIWPQPSVAPEGSGHEIAKGGLPEKQPSKKEQ